MATNLLDKLQETCDFIRSTTTLQPTIGIVLGSGLGNFTNELQVERSIPYEQIPNFPVSTVEGHQGKLLIGHIDAQPVIAMAGRFHFYEGYSAADVVFPIRVMKQLGVNTLFVSNAAGGLNANFKVGDIMIIRDHISFFVTNPLIGKNESALGPRFPDMSEPYSKKMIAKAKEIAAQHQIVLHEGVYAGVTGPTFESRAEYKLLRLLGGDAVGMSTVQEVIVAAHMGMQVFAMSVITDIGIREEENVITHEEVLQAARDAEPKLTTIFKQLITTS
jgi:purine-nucleoside phosphorylase